LSESSVNHYIDDFFTSHDHFLKQWYPGLKMSRLKEDLLAYAKGEDHLLAEFFQQVKKGIPLQYILGEASFYSHSFKVSPDVLIPRFETETLVELVLGELKKMDGVPEVLDLGTGSGVIALSLMGERNLDCWASDISSKALEIARENYQRLKGYLKGGKITFVKSDRFFNIVKKFHFIVSNPPYIKRRSDLDTVHIQVAKYEPHQALFLEDEDYENWYKSFFSQAMEHLYPGGVLLLEGHENHLLELKLLATKSGFCKVSILEDLCGRKRYLKACG
jgi:release factor glutamine methyltransferase